MSDRTASISIPTFSEGIEFFAETLPGNPEHAATPCLGPNTPAVTNPADPAAAYQSLLLADAMRYLTLHVTAAKASGHPGGFSSSAELIAALIMLGQKHLMTEVGHHAPGYYSAAFLDRSLETIGIRTVTDFAARYREHGGLLGHLSGAIPGLLNPAGPLGQGQHFAMTCAHLNPGVLFPVTIGDGGIGEPYVMSAFGHFWTAFPSITNVLPILIWNGYSQEHHSMISAWTNEAVTGLWTSYGTEQVIMIDAADFGGNAPFADSTVFPWETRMQFMQHVLHQTLRAIESALSGKPTVLVFKQLKGAGSHATGARSHNLYPQHVMSHPDIAAGLTARALSPHAWAIVRENCAHAAGGPASEVVVTERVRMPVAVPALPVTDFAVDRESKVPTTAIGEMVIALAEHDPQFFVTNADGNAASGMGNINAGLGIVHPSSDSDYSQRPDGRVYEPLSEDACAAFAAARALYGERALWCSYESFAVNGMPIWQTVTQAMAELRRPSPPAISLFTAGALEQGRNGWTHQRPEIESYYAALMRNGNVYPLFPPDANTSQAAFAWALEQKNSGVAIFASKTALPVRLSFTAGREAVENGAVALYQSDSQKHEVDVVFAVLGDMVLLPVMEATREIEARGKSVRVVSVVNPRRLCVSEDVAWKGLPAEDGRFLSDNDFHALFGCNTLVAVSGGTSALLEPVIVRSNASRRLVRCWRRGDTVAGPEALYRANNLDAHSLADLVSDTMRE